MIECNMWHVKVEGLTPALAAETLLLLNALEKSDPGFLDKLFKAMTLAATVQDLPACKWVKENIKNDADT